MSPVWHIAQADPGELDLLRQWDPHTTKLAEKIDQGEVLVARVATGPVGCLRFGFFWDAIPFMNLLFVAESWRSRGIGTALVTDWETRMARMGCREVMTSTQANETAQHFYRKLGYADIGQFLLPAEPHAELLLHKSLA